MLTHAMRTRTVAHSLLLKILRKYADMRLSPNFFKNFVIIIFLAYNFFKDKATDKARDENRDKA